MLRLTVENVGQKFGRRVLFRRLSFELKGGQTLAITGPNGSGKTTLLRILAGVLKPSTGDVRLSLNGETVPPDDHPLRTGFVAPYINVYDGFTARENLLFLARLRRLPDAAKRIEEVLDLVGLSQRADDLVGTYSSGMKQRVKFAAATLTEPPLLLLDEPSTNLDAAGLTMVRQVIEMQLAARRLLIIATNDREEAQTCERILSIPDYTP